MHVAQRTHLWDTSVVNITCGGRSGRCAGCWIMRFPKALDTQYILDKNTKKEQFL